MNRSEIAMNARKVWHLLYDCGRWNYEDLKRNSGMCDRDLNAALGWLAHEDKITFSQEKDKLYVSLGVNVYIG